jgi:hypothetical protein
METSSGGEEVKEVLLISGGLAAAFIAGVIFSGVIKGLLHKGFSWLAGRV